MKEEIIITNQTKMSQVIQAITAAGPDKFHVLSDFDRTLTKAFAQDGSEVPSLISILRDEGYLTPDYPEKAKALFNYYHAMEIDSKISKDDKKNKMEEWWRKHSELLIASHLNKSDVERAVLSQRLQFRDGVKEFLEFLQVREIPLIIMSSGGLGKEAISLYLKNQNCLFENIFIVSNEFIWDKNGFAVAVEQPIIHSLSKEETTLKDLPFFPKVEPRKNVLLLGDSIDDVDMVVGFDYENLIKIGFLNKPIPENQIAYQKKYDILILNDGSFNKVNELLRQMFE